MLNLFRFSGSHAIGTSKCQIMGSIPTTVPMYRPTDVPAYPRTRVLTYRRAVICNLSSTVRRFFSLFRSWSSPISWGGKRNHNWVLSFHWFDPEDDHEIVAENPLYQSQRLDRAWVSEMRLQSLHDWLCDRYHGRRWCPPCLEQAYKRRFSAWRKRTNRMRCAEALSMSLMCRTRLRKSKRKWQFVASDPEASGACFPPSFPSPGAHKNNASDIFGHEKEWYRYFPSSPSMCPLPEPPAIVATLTSTTRRGRRRPSPVAVHPSPGIPSLPGRFPSLSSSSSSSRLA